MDTKNSVPRVLEKFPESWHVIVQLAQENADFREQCEHLAECELTLARLQEEGGEAKRIDEYETLMRELEQEIERCVAKVRYANLDQT